MACAHQTGRPQAAGVAPASLRAPCRSLPPQQPHRSPSMLPWLLQLTSWVRGGHTGAAAACAVAPAALSSSDQAALQAAAAAKPDAEHLVVMVHGLFGTRDNWRAIRTLLEEHLDRRATALFVSHCNERTKTFDGIDTCGERLAEEIRAVAAQHPRLRRISILAHSMGGLISRYAVGRLYDPATRTVAGLAPCHFVCIATPHLGCDTRLSPAQVPLINWLSAVPAVGGAVHTVVSGLAAPVSSIALGRAGLQFFFMDSSSRPMIGSSNIAASSSSSSSSGGSGAAGSNLVSSSAPSSNALSSHANGGGGRQEPLLYRLSQDQPDEGLLFISALSAFETRTLYANSSGDHLVGWANSSLRRLHELPPKNGRGTGVIREDPLEFAWRPEQRPALHATPAAADLHSGESHRVSSAAILQAHTAEELAAGSSSAGGSGANGAGSGANDSSILGSSSSSSMDQQALGMPRSNAAVASSSTTAEQVRLAASAAATQPAGGGDPSGSSRDGGSSAAASSIALPLTAGQQSRAHEQRLEEMLARLQALGWRRVDVCFAGAPLPFLAHQHIQQQRVINWPGQATVKHLALQLAAMEQLRAAGQQRSAPAVHGAEEGH